MWCGLLEAGQVDENYTHYTHNRKERVLPDGGLDYIEEAIYNYRDTGDVVIHGLKEVLKTLTQKTKTTNNDFS